MEIKIYKITSCENNGEYTTVDICSINGVYGLAEDIEKRFNQEELKELKELKKKKYSKWYIAKWILNKRDYQAERLEFDTKDFYIQLIEMD